MRYTTGFGGYYYHEGDLGQPVLLALHGWLQRPGNKGCGFWNFVEHSGLLQLTLAKNCTLVTPKAGFLRNWSGRDGERIGSLAKHYSSYGRVIGLGFSDGVRGLLEADYQAPETFSSLICVSGVYSPSQEISPVGCPAWFCCGTRDIASVAESLAEFSYAFRDRGSRIGRFDGKHRWPQSWNEKFYEWATSGYTID